jgi:hypothetical protein
MVDHSLARQRRVRASRAGPSAGDFIFTMIGDRVSRMLTRPSEINSKLKDIETTAASSRRSPRKRMPRPGMQPLAGPEEDVLLSLYNVIAQLSSELSELRDEQRILRTQVAELHRVVLLDEV